MRLPSFIAACAAAAVLLGMPVRAAEPPRHDALPATSNAAPVTADTPEAFITDIYRFYVGRQSKGIDLTRSGAPARYFTPTMAALIVADQKEAQGEVGRLDSDVFVNGQDWSLTQIPTLKTTVTAPDRATVKAAAVNGGGEIRFSLVKGAKGWRIEDIAWQGSSDTLLQMLKRPL